MPGDIEGVAVPGDGLIKQKDLDDKDAPQSQNSYTEEEKFEMALTMAESLADLHGFRDGVMYVLICKFFFLPFCYFGCSIEKKIWLLLIIVFV